MRLTAPTLKIVALATMGFFFLILVAEVMARRGGRSGGRSGQSGRAHYTRVGPASGGSFASRPARPRQGATRTRVKATQPRASSIGVQRERPRPLPVVPPEERQERREEIHEKRQERREEIHDEHWDNYYHRHPVAVGTVYTYSDFSPEYCEASVVMNGVTYYQCDDDWYKRAYSGGAVTWVVVDGPGD